MYCYSRNRGFQQKGLVLKRGENELSEKSELSDWKALRDPGQTWKSPTRALGQEGSPAGPARARLGRRRGRSTTLSVAAMTVGKTYKNLC